MAQTIHTFDNSSVTTRRATAYVSDNPKGELVTANGTSGNGRIFTYFATREAIPGSGTAGNIGSIGCHGADTAIPLPFGVFVVVESSGTVGIDTRPNNFNSN